MSYEITKVFKLDAGHRTWTQDMRKGRGKELYSSDLPYSYNKCANIHGHSLLISVTLSTETLDQQHFVIDTDLLKIPIQKIIDKMDHSFIMDRNDPLFDEFKKITSKANLRLYEVDFSPSFEGLAEYFYDIVEKIIADLHLEDEIKVVKTNVCGEGMTVQASFNR